MQTAWGYEVNNLEPLLSVDEFIAMTGSTQEEAKIEAALLAASQAVRNYCGWHISPALECLAYPPGGTKVTRIPAGYVSSINAVREEGKTLTEGQYEWRRDGLLRRACFKNWSSRWEAIEVEYVAGYDIEAVPDLAEAVRSIAEGVIAVSAGIVSETADGVSISYSQSASSIAASLTEQQKFALNHYKVVNAYGA